MACNHLHIVGGGLAGFSAALEALKANIPCTIYESTPKCGGRIREVNGHDNATHLIVEGYRDTFDYLKEVGTIDGLKPLKDAGYQFKEPADNLEWFVPARHFIGQVAKGCVPDIHPFNISSALAKHRLWHPFFLAVFNTNPTDIPNREVRRLFFEMLKRGPNCLTPYFSNQSLVDLFMKPLLAQLDIRYGKRLCAIMDHRLVFRGETIELDKDDRVILALSPDAYKHIDGPFKFDAITSNPITNIHFYLDEEQDDKFIGLIGTKSQWVHIHNKIASVTISNHFSESKSLVGEVWAEISPLIGSSPMVMPENKIVCEKHATVLQNHNFYNTQPQYRTKMLRFFLAGDWIDTGLPATIESAIRSGKMAFKGAVTS